MESRKRTKKQIGRSLALLAVIVVIFPAISWYYLQKGLDFRNMQLDKLENLGKIVAFQSKNEKGLELGSSIKENVLLVSTGALACTSQKAQTLREYVDKFQNQDVFRHVILADEKCPNWNTSFFAMRAENEEFSKRINDLLDEQLSSTHVLLVDREGVVRSVYDLTKTEDLEALVTHTTVLLPPLKKRG